MEKIGLAAFTMVAISIIAFFNPIIDFVKSIIELIKMKKEHDLYNNPPLLEIENASRTPIKCDIRKNPLDESYIRVTIKNPNIQGIFVSLEASEDFINNLVRGYPSLRNNNGTDIGKTPFGRQVTLEPSGIIFFDIFLHKNKLSDFIGKSYKMVVKDNKDHKVQKDFTL